MTRYSRAAAGWMLAGLLFTGCGDGPPGAGFTEGPPKQFDTENSARKPDGALVNPPKPAATGTAPAATPTDKPTPKTTDAPAK